LIKNDASAESQISQPNEIGKGPSQILQIGKHLYKGIQVKVSFSGQAEGTMTLNHLSGGQKAVVAVALLFAL